MDLDGIIANLEKKLAQEEVVRQRAFEVFTQETEEMDRRVKKKTGDYDEKVINKIFNEAIDAFYSSYAIKSYHRHNSLYNILSIQKDANGLVILDDPDYDSLFDESEMTTMRDGGSLFDHVFKEGWHGGAAGTDRWGDSVDTPHYRTGKNFIHWDGPAAQASPSPYEDIVDKISAAESDFLSMFRKYDAEEWAKTSQKIIRKIQDIERSAFAG